MHKPAPLGYMLSPVAPVEREQDAVRQLLCAQQHVAARFAGDLQRRAAAASVLSYMRFGGGVLGAEACTGWNK